MASAISVGLAFAALDFLAVVSVASYSKSISVWIPIVISSLLVFVVAGLFAELNGIYPSAAGVRLYMQKALGTNFAVVVMLAYSITIILAIAADAFIIGSAINFISGESSQLTYLWIVLLLAAAVISNLMGVKIAGWLEALITLIIVLGVGLISGFGVSKIVGHPNYLGFFNQSPVRIFQALIFAVFLYAAFEWVVTSAEEANNKKTIPRALFIAPVILLVICVLFGVALTGLVKFSSFHQSPYPQLLLGKAVFGRVGEFLMLFITLITAINTFNGGFMVASRFLYAAAREGILPKAFAKLNLKFVPSFAVISLGLLCMLGALVVYLTKQWLVLVSVGSVLEAIIYAIAGICVLIFRKRKIQQGGFKMFFGNVFAVLVLIIFIPMALLGAFSNPKNPSQFSLLPAAVIVVIFFLAFIYSKTVLPKLVKSRQNAAVKRRRPTKIVAQ
jgi:APA family basic amino acid/polyamine antiporter